MPEPGENVPTADDFAGNLRVTAHSNLWQVFDSPAHPWLLFPHAGPLMKVQDSTTVRVLLSADIRDGRIVADYDPADLDEAARIFAEGVLALMNRTRA